MKRWGLLALCVGVGGCLDVVDTFDPAVGPAVAGRCVNDDSDPDTDVLFSQDIQPILREEAGPVGCSCHQPTDPNPIGFEQTGLDLSSFAGLRAGGNNSLSGVIVEGQPCDSILWQKINPGPPFGSQMPFDGPPFLTEAQRRLIADWIAEGARDN